MPDVTAVTVAELEQAYVQAKRESGGQSLPALRVAYALACALAAAERWTEAKQLHRSVLEQREARLGLDHPETDASLAALAGVLEAVGEAALAEPLYKRLLLVWEERGGRQGAVPPCLSK